MRLPGTLSRVPLALLPFLLSMAPLNAWGQVQRPVPNRRAFATHCCHSYKKWLDEDARWIITDEERAEYAKLATDDQRDDFIEKFWQHRNPTPGPENPYKEEHYRRIGYANTHFASGVAGWKTDRGRFYIVYGQPDKTEYLPYVPDSKDASKASYQSEVWHYVYVKGLGRDMVISFVDTCRCGDYVLTRESENPPNGMLDPDNRY